MADRLKKDPITPETIITTQYYRIITGACEMGVKGWIDSHIPAAKREDILKNGITAKDLLPLLEKTGAYGVSKFRELVKF